jgi:hypothetical protein
MQSKAHNFICVTAQVMGVPPHGYIILLQCMGESVLDFVL